MATSSASSEGRPVTELAITAMWQRPSSAPPVVGARIIAQLPSRRETSEASSSGGASGEAPAGTEQLRAHVVREASASRVQGDRPVLYFPCGNGKVRTLDLTRQQQAVLSNASQRLQEHCGYDKDNHSGWTVNWLTSSVSFIDEDGDEKWFSLQQILEENPDISDVVEDALETIEEVMGGRFRMKSYHPNSKGPSDGGVALRRNPTLSQLPYFKDGAQAYENAMKLSRQTVTDPNDRQMAIVRMAAAERILVGARDALQIEIDKLREEIAQLPDDADEVAQKRQDLKQLESKYEELENVDTYALYAALAFYPVGQTNSQQIRERADALQQQMSEELGEGAEDSRLYSIDAAGLMFAGMSPTAGRSGYMTYCVDNGVYAKNECLEDKLLREIILGENNPDNTLTDGLFADIESEEIRDNLTDELNDAIATSRDWLVNGLDVDDPSDDEEELIGQARFAAGLIDAP